MSSKSRESFVNVRPLKLLASYFPRKDSSAAGVRCTELMFLLMRSLTLEVVFDENDWTFMSLLKRIQVSDLRAKNESKRDYTFISFYQICWTASKKKKKQKPVKQERVSRGECGEKPRARRMLNTEEYAGRQDTRELKQRQRRRERHLKI